MGGSSGGRRYLCLLGVLVVVVKSVVVWNAGTVEATETHALLQCARVASASASSFVDDVMKTAVPRPRAMVTPTTSAREAAPAFMRTTTQDAQLNVSPVANFDAYDELTPTSRFPGVRYKRRRVPRMGFDMQVFYTPFNDDDDGCRPVILFLHPAQVFQVIPNHEFWNTCSYFAAEGFLCIASMEGTGEFARGIDDAQAEGLARRGLEMLRTLYTVENNDPSSVFYNRVCNRACVTGYSLGGMAAQSVAWLANEADGIECIAPIHSGFSMPYKVNKIGVPVLIGSSVDDTVTPVGPIGLQFKYGRRSPPTIQVVLREGHEHILGSLCGNDCPMNPGCCWPGYTNMMVHIKWMVPFFKLYLMDELKYAGALWDIPGENPAVRGIGDETKVYDVILYPRVAATPARTIPLRAGVDTGSRVDIAIGENLSSDTVFMELKLTSVRAATDGLSDDECLRFLRVETDPAVAVDSDMTTTFDAFIAADPALATNCVLGFQIMTAKRALSNVITVSVVVDCELTSWTEWTDDCACCAAGPLATTPRRMVSRVTSPVSRASQLASSSSSSSLPPESAIGEVRAWARDRGELGVLMPQTNAWMASGAKEETLREFAAEEVVDVLMSAEAAPKSSPCASIKKVLDLNGDGHVDFDEADAALGFAARFMPSPGATSRSQAAAARTGVVTRGNALRNVVEDEDEDDDDILLETFRLALASDDAVAARSAVAAARAEDASSSTMCERSRSFSPSPSGGATFDTCLEQLGVDLFYEQRSCDPDCPVTSSDPPTPPPGGSNPPTSSIFT